MELASNVLGFEYLGNLPLLFPIHYDWLGCWLAPSRYSINWSRFELGHVDGWVSWTKQVREREPHCILVDYGFNRVRTSTLGSELARGLGSADVLHF